MTTSARTEDNPMFSFTKSIGYILAGAYVVKLMLPILSTNGELDISNCFTYAVGWIVVIFGIFYFLIIPFRSKSIFKLISVKLDSLSNIFLPLLFVITFSQLIDLLYDINIAFTLVGSLIAVFVFTMGIISTIKKSFFNIRNLIYMSAVLTGFSTITIFLSDFDRILLIKSSLALSTILIFGAVYLLQKNGAGK
ncbi:hypothetical protein ACFLTL_01900 [Chloroflexota bacterium]